MRYADRLPNSAGILAYLSQGQRSMARDSRHRTQLDRLRSRGACDLTARLGAPRPAPVIGRGESHLNEPKGGARRGRVGTGRHIPKQPTTEYT
jgi:hypothetical protein